jgi:hypothetical protein
MPQRRRRAGLERRQVDAELIKPARIAKSLAFTPLHHALERRRIISAAIDAKPRNVDLRHLL